MALDGLMDIPLFLCLMRGINRADMKMLSDGRMDRQAHRYIPQTFWSGDKNA